MAAANEPDGGHASCRGGAHTSRRVLDDDTVGRLNTHPRRYMQEEIGGGLAVRYLGRRKQKIEELREPGGFQACPDTLRWGRRRHAFGPTQPCERTDTWALKSKRKTLFCYRIATLSYCDA